MPHRHRMSGAAWRPIPASRRPETPQRATTARRGSHPSTPDPAGIRRSSSPRSASIQTRHPAIASSRVARARGSRWSSIVHPMVGPEPGTGKAPRRRDRDGVDLAGQAGARSVGWNAIVLGPAARAILMLRRRPSMPPTGRSHRHARIRTHPVDTPRPGRHARHGVDDARVRRRRGTASRRNLGVRPRPRMRADVTPVRRGIADARPRRYRPGPSPADDRVLPGIGIRSGRDAGVRGVPAHRGRARQPGNRCERCLAARVPHPSRIRARRADVPVRVRLPSDDG